MMNIFGKKKKSISIDKKDSLESLFSACQNGIHELAVKILQQGSFIVNGTDDQGRSPLHVSCLNGHLKVVQALISFSADLNQNDNNGWTPLHCAATSRFAFVIL
jgi:ankyrin repeat protein